MFYIPMFEKVFPASPTKRFAVTPCPINKNDLLIDIGNMQNQAIVISLRTYHPGFLKFLFVSLDSLA